MSFTPYRCSAPALANSARITSSDEGAAADTDGVMRGAFEPETAPSRAIPLTPAVAASPSRLGRPLDLPPIPPGGSGRHRSAAVPATSSP